MILASVFGGLVAALLPVALCQQPGPIQLPAAVTSGGKPLMEALAARRSTREFGQGTLTFRQISNLLWAEFGIYRTQEIDNYVITAGGTYLYDARKHCLEPVTAGDLRRMTGEQDFEATAALNLVYVAELKRAPGASAEDGALFPGANAGFPAQNVYLYCAPEGLAAAVRGEKRILLAQTIGTVMKNRRGAY